MQEQIKKISKIFYILMVLSGQKEWCY